MDVSVILVNYNSSDLLGNAVDSLINHTLAIEYEIIIVDNNSPDGSVKLIAQRFGDKIRLLELGQNIGFGLANNEGIKIARGRNIFFLNPDTLLLNNAVKILSDYLDENKNTGIAGGNLYNENEEHAFSFRRFLPSPFWEANDLLFTLPERIIYGRNRYHNHRNRPLNVGYITGADLMIPRWVLDKVGGFGPGFFLYFEEADLARRVKKNSLKITNLPDARIIHYEGKSFQDEEERAVRYNLGRIVYYRENYNTLTWYILKMIIALTLYSRMSIFAVLLNRKGYERWRKMAGYYYAARKEYEEK